MNLSIFATLTSWSWWVDSRPLSSNLWLWTTFIIPLVGIGVALAVKIYYRPRFQALQDLKGSWIKLINYCASLSLVILFGRWQQLPVLGMRLLHGTIGAVFILIGLVLFLRRLTKINKQIAQESVEHKLNKYLPKIK